MNSSDQEKIAAVIPSLKILDVILMQANFSRPSEEWKGEGIGTPWQQHKRGVRYSVEMVNDHRELQVLVQLGTRLLIGGEKPDNGGAVQFAIEADFLVRYAAAEDVDDASLDAFATFNAVHNAWPFWRQHVFDIVQRARLPHLEVPLFSGTKS